MPDFVSALKLEISQLEKDIADDPRVAKLRELKRLLGMYETGVNIPRPSVVAPPAERSRRATSATRQAAIDAARIFLRDRLEPTKTADIYAHIKGLGIDISGENPQNNLSAMLNHSPEFRSYGRNGWVLVGTTSETAREVGATVREGNTKENCQPSISSDEELFS